MVPSVFVRLERLPLNVNGKVDRAALPEPGRPPRSERYVAPRNELEQTLADIWAELLRVERVGVDESFFELGGHSLLATQVISRVSESLQVEVPLRTLFESPTVGGLAEAVARLAGQQSARPAPINPGARSLEEQTLAGVELMSEEDVDAMLARMLSEKEGDA
jgi:acyl carrier protein